MDLFKGEVLLVNKPHQWTSFDAVNKIRHLLKKILLPEAGRKLKIGHAGTLDPLATGLLIICTGRLTRQIEQFQNADKEYTGTFFMGAVTPTYDLESEPENFKDFSSLTHEHIYACAKKLTGSLMQIPPAHSAMKIDGQRAYKRARKGQQVVLKPRPVTIHEFEITHIELPVVSFRIVCSKGTYIRSLAHDFGQLAGTGAYLSSLCRTRIGNFLLKDARTPDELVQELKNQLIANS
jgi:tRNA pseudouridine55 synthase